MLMTLQEARYLEKYLTPIDNSDVYHCDKPEKVPKNIAKDLLERDAEFTDVYGYHMIDNYEELRA